MVMHKSPFNEYMNYVIFQENNAEIRKYVIYRLTKIKKNLSQNVKEFFLPTKIVLSQAIRIDFIAQFVF